MKRMGYARACRLTVEPLEDRCVPAGNVLLHMSSGMMILTGDNAHNNIAVRTTLDGFFVEGRDGTTVNGQASELVSEPLAGVCASTGNGNDVFAFEGVDGYWGLSMISIDTGKGDDKVVVDMARQASFPSLHVVTGNGDDVVSVNFRPGFTFHWPGLFLDTGDGNDSVDIEGTLQGVRVGTFQIWLGRGDDSLNVDLFTTIPTRLQAQFVEIDGGAGNDRISGNTSFLEFAGGIPMYDDFEFVD